MSLFCFKEEMEFESSQQPSEIISALNTIVDSSQPTSTLGLFSKAEYVGQISDKHFEICCRQPYLPLDARRNSFLPILYGTIEQIPGGSKIKTHFDIHSTLKIAIVLFMVLVLCIVSQIYKTEGNIPLLLLILLVMPILGSLIVSTFSDDRKKLIDLVKLITMRK
jgi:hypothetical protein